MEEKISLTILEKKDSIIHKKGVWSFNFFLLWQGALVSEIGNNIHTIAMAFWLLQKTGSTAIMGSITSVGLLVHSIVCLFSGAIVDKRNKRNVMAVTDLFQGLLYTALGIAAFFHVLELWMIVAIGVLGGICSAFFFPASQSLIPEIVPVKKLMRANAFMIMVILGAPVIGNGFGGHLFQSLGAPLLFLGNGISFFISSFAVSCIRIPKRKTESKKITLFRDIKEGYQYLIRQKGLRFLLAAAVVMNIFAFLGLFLILPFFERTAGLGPSAFGIAMACMAAGGCAGMISSTLFTIKAEGRFKVYAFCLIGMTVLPIFIPYYPLMPVLCTLGFFAGFMRAYVFLIFNVVIQLNVAKDKMGRVFGLIGILLHIVNPLGMIIGGMLAEFFPIDLLITLSFAISGLAILPIFLYRPCRRMFAKEDRE